MNKRPDGTTIWIHHDTKKLLNEIKDNLELSGYSKSYNDIIFSSLTNLTDRNK